MLVRTHIATTLSERGDFHGYYSNKARYRTKHRDWLGQIITLLLKMMCKQDSFSSTLFKARCKVLSVLSAASLAALITSFIRQLGRVILSRECLSIVFVCYLKNNLRISPRQPIHPLSWLRNIQAIMLISCEKPFIYWPVNKKGHAFSKATIFRFDHSGSAGFPPPV